MSSGSPQRASSTQTAVSLRFWWTKSVWEQKPMTLSTQFLHWFSQPPLRAPSSLSSRSLLWHAHFHWWNGNELSCTPQTCSNERILHWNWCVPPTQLLLHRYNNHHVNIIVTFCDYGNFRGVMLGLEPRASHRDSMPSPSELHPQPPTTQCFHPRKESWSAILSKRGTLAICSESNLTHRVEVGAVRFLTEYLTYFCTNTRVPFILSHFPWESMF